MRELFRSKARAEMQRAGYTRLNKPIPSGTVIYPSVFAQRWREFA
ncbi:hypothetical protein [Colidextribacter sp. OB.20]|nr:hypothetical protein [Colidextribacter sp. OB.20]